MAPGLNASLSKAQKAFIVSGAFSSSFLSRVRFFISNMSDSFLFLGNSLSTYCPFRSVSCLVFQEDSLFAEVADQVERYPERDDILVEKQTQETHIPYAVNGNGRAGGSEKHRTGGEEHYSCDEGADDAGFRPEIACSNQ